MPCQSCLSCALALLTTALGTCAAAAAPPAQPGREVYEAAEEDKLLSSALIATDECSAEHAPEALFGCTFSALQLHSAKVHGDIADHASHSGEAVRPPQHSVSAGLQGVLVPALNETRPSRSSIADVDVRPNESTFSVNAREHRDAQNATLFTGHPSREIVAVEVHNMSSISAANVPGESVPTPAEVGEHNRSIEASAAELAQRAASRSSSSMRAVASAAGAPGSGAGDDDNSLKPAQAAESSDVKAPPRLPRASLATSLYSSLQAVGHLIHPEATLGSDEKPPVTGTFSAAPRLEAVFIFVCTMVLVGLALQAFS